MKTEEYVKFNYDLFDVLNERWLEIESLKAEIREKDKEIERLKSEISDITYRNNKEMDILTDEILRMIDREEKVEDELRKAKESLQYMNRTITNKLRQMGVQQ